LPGEHMFDRVPSMRRCDFCGSRVVKWVYPADRDWLACEKCHAAIQADDREALLDRASQIPVPRPLPERYADKSSNGLVGFTTSFGTPARVRLAPPSPVEPAFYGLER
jgi:hypothetical protein